MASIESNTKPVTLHQTLVNPLVL